MNGIRYYPRAIQPVQLRDLSNDQLDRCYEKAVAWTEMIAARMDNPRLTDADDNERAWHLVERCSWEMENRFGELDLVDQALYEIRQMLANPDRYQPFAYPFVNGAQA